jgi:hypothetical protein
LSAPAVDSATLAKDRLGIPAVLYFILSAMAPMTVVAGVVTTMYAVTGLSAIGAAFVAVALVLAVFAAGYVAMARYVTNAGVLYACISPGARAARGRRRRPGRGRGLQPAPGGPLRHVRADPGRLPGRQGRAGPPLGAARRPGPDRAAHRRPKIASLTQSTVGAGRHRAVRSTLLGLPPGSTEAWALPASFAVAAVLGVLYGRWQRSARPDVYQGIGLGADALTAR